MREEFVNAASLVFGLALGFAMALFIVTSEFNEMETKLAQAERNLIKSDMECEKQRNKDALSYKAFMDLELKNLQTKIRKHSE